MKKSCIIFLLSIIISLTALGFSGVFGAKNANEAPMYALNAILRGRTEARKGTVFGRKKIFSKTRKKSEKSRKNT